MHTNPSKLALEIAQALDDMDSLQMHEQFVRKYHEDLLRKILMKVLAIPPEKIKRTRGALFTYLVNNQTPYGNRYSRN